MRAGTIKESEIHFELHRCLQNVIDQGLSYKDVTFWESIPEYSQNLAKGQRADIVVFDTKKKPWLVIETKKKSEEGDARKFDPYSRDVIGQALGYAQQLGAPFFATYNGEVLVLFKTFEEFKPLSQRKSKSYRITEQTKLAEQLLRDIITLHKGDTKWDEIDEAFISRVKYLHQQLYPYYHMSLLRKISSDKKFHHEFTKWAKEQGFDIDNNRTEVEKNFAKQAAYLIINQLLFYQMISNARVYKDRIPQLLPMEDPSGLSKEIDRCFSRIVADVDFRAVFESDVIFNRIPITREIAQSLNEFLSELIEYDLGIFDGDVIGKIYEELIPAKERHDLGQYYTPPLVADLIVNLCVKIKSDSVLDPACGSGTFLVSAYKRLQSLYSETSEEASHNKILSQIFGIDINRFPAHLSAINLAVRDITSRTDNVQIEIADFFDIKSMQGMFARKTATVTGEAMEEPVAIPSKVRVVLANPPYIRSMNIENKDKVCAHLERIKASVSKRADIYAFFFTHAYEFLEDGGRIGFITSDRWLDTDYGKELQKFFLDHFKIIALIKFDRQVFSDALIGNCITILERNGDRQSRDNNLVNFVRIKRNMNMNKIAKLVEGNYEEETMNEVTNFRIVTMKQSNLTQVKKWNSLFYAPAIYYEIIVNDKLTELGNVADIVAGISTGANEFFYLKREDIKELGLDEKFFYPIMKAIAQANYLDFKKEESEWLVLDLHPIIMNELKIQESEELMEITSLCKKKLKEAGYNSIVRYIERGETKGYNKNAKGKNGPWFDLGELPEPFFLFPKEYWKMAPVVINIDGVTIDTQVHGVNPHNDIDPMILGGILNSDLILLMRELHGRVAMGEALNRNRILVNEARELPIIDLRKLNENERKRIKNAFEVLVAKSRKGSEQDIVNARRELNRAVLATIRMEDRAEEVQSAAVELLEIRVKGGAVSKEIMIAKEERPKVVKIKLSEKIYKL